MLIGASLSLQWTVKKLGEPGPAGTPYDLLLEETGRPVFIQADDDGRLIGRDTPRTTWYIDGNDGGPYTSVPVYLSALWYP